MPNVPNVPGVPPLSSFLEETVEILASDLISLVLGTPESLWTVLLDGEQAFDFHSIAGFGFKQEWSIAEYQVENGSFFSYDKVQLPFHCRLRITSGGTQEERQALIEEITDAANTLNLYDVVTPEKVYSNCNVSLLDYDRSALSGVGMMVIDVTFQEIRTSEASTFSNTQRPGSAGQQGGGNVQPTKIGGPGNIQSFPLGDVQ